MLTNHSVLPKKMPVGARKKPPKLVQFITDVAKRCKIAGRGTAQDEERGA